MLGASVFMTNSAHKNFLDQFIGRHSMQQLTDVFTLFSYTRYFQPVVREGLLGGT